MKNMNVTVATLENVGHNAKINVVNNCKPRDFLWIQFDGNCSPEWWIRNPSARQCKQVLHLNWLIVAYGMENNVSVRRLKGLFMDKQRITRWKRSFKRANVIFLQADSFVIPITRRKALHKALDNYTSIGKTRWNPCPMLAINQKNRINNYDTLYNFLCRRPVNIIRFWSFFDLASPCFNLPWHFNNKGFFDYTRTWGNPYRKPQSLCRLHSGQIGFSSKKALA